MESSESLPKLRDHHLSCTALAGQMSCKNLQQLGSRYMALARNWSIHSHVCGEYHEIAIVRPATSQNHERKPGLKYCESDSRFPPPPTKPRLPC
jgi:hypothetical protein